MPSKSVQAMFVYGDLHPDLPACAALQAHVAKMDLLTLLRVLLEHSAVHRMCQLTIHVHELLHLSHCTVRSSAWRASLRCK